MVKLCVCVCVYKTTVLAYIYICTTCRQFAAIYNPGLPDRPARSLITIQTPLHTSPVGQQTFHRNTIRVTSPHSAPM